jgi:hypothetical protein
MAEDEHAVLRLPVAQREPGKIILNPPPEVVADEHLEGNVWRGKITTPGLELGSETMKTALRRFDAEVGRIIAAGKPILGYFLSIRFRGLPGLIEADAYDLAKYPWCFPVKTAGKPKIRRCARSLSRIGGELPKHAYYASKWGKEFGEEESES